MSALVSYESSSEEEGHSIKTARQPRSEQTPSAAVNGNASYGTSAPESIPKISAAQADEGPMVGPQIQQVDNEPFGGYYQDDEEADDSNVQPMSERDTIRYLTQPTHPMTSLPPSPPGTPDVAATARIKKFLDLKARGVHFNADLANKSTFQNPSLLSTLMVRAGVDGTAQYLSTLPEDIYDPSMLPAWAYKEELLKSQQKLREQREVEKKSLSAQGKRTIEFARAGADGSGESRGSTPASGVKRRKP